MKHHRAVTNVRRNLLCSALVFALAAGGVATSAFAQDGVERKQFEVPEQSAATALNQFAEQADITLVFSQDVVSGVTVHPLRGAYTTQEGLAAMLEGTGLAWQNIDGRTISIGRESPGGDGKAGVRSLDTIVVTGTRIRGIESVSPVSVYTNEDIERSGYATVQQFLRTLPQNFGGGQSDQAGNVSGMVTFTSLGSGVNLRGLGTEATLVLLNGQRLAPAGTGNFVDVGMIPASAIERVEVLTDGASAIYGSDAVGGVVNVVLRSDFEGGDTRLRYGNVSEGSSAEYRASQALGWRWDGGNLVGSYEFYKREALDSRDRAATRIMPEPSDIFAGETRHSLLLHLEQALGVNTELVADLQYGKRGGHARDVDFIGSLLDYDLNQVQYGGRLGLIRELRGSWQGEVFATYSYNTNDVVQRTDGMDPAIIPSTSSSVTTLDFKADGDAFGLPGGNAKAAIGGQLRTEKLDYVTRGISQLRDAGSLFGEISLPLVGAENRMSGVQELIATAALRYDYYDDSGDSTNAMFGLRWRPTDGVAVRATYGTSFRAPSLIDISPVADQVIALLLPGVGGAPVVSLLFNGSNPGLEPETAKSWTLGIDLVPRGPAGPHVGITYYDIDYQDRIASLARDPRAFLALQYESIFGEVITSNPSQQQVAELVAHPRFFNATPLSTEQLIAGTEAILDLRSRNLSGTRTRGLDLNLDYKFVVSDHLLGATFNVNYVLEHAQQLTGLSPWEDRVGTTLNPVRFRLRGGLNWARGGTSAGATVNHTDSYSNVLVSPAAPVDSWTTVDLSLRHEFKNYSGFSVSASVVNLFNAQPPYLEAVLPLIANYDPTNADVLGRFLSLQVSKEW